MGDFLLDLNPTARKLIGTLGLPLPLPQKLARGDGAWRDRPLEGQTAFVHGGGSMLARTLGRAGAEVVLVGGATDAFEQAAEAWGRPLRTTTIAELAVPEQGEATGVAALKPNAIIFDGTGLADVSELRALYDFVHPIVRRIARCGRIVILGRPTGESPQAAASAAALLGFVKSLAKEVGRKGATANLLQIAEGAEHRAEPALRWLLSVRSAYVTAQSLRIDVASPADSNTPWTRPLEGRTALVTGAARGIGRATAQRLAEEGARVICLDRPEDDASLADVARAIGGKALPCDITDPEAAARIQDASGGIDILVQNAGVTRDRTLAKMTEQSWDLCLAVNLEAVIRTTQQLRDSGTLRDGGRVILLSSVAGIAGNMGQTNYAASKAGLIGYLSALAPTLAGAGITVNAVAPGFIETRLTAAIPVATREAGRRLAALSQGGLPVDIAEAVTFLASPGAAGVTGQVMRVCGGNFIGA